MEKVEKKFEKQYCTICGRECGIKGVSPSQLCLECFKKENEIKGFQYYKGKFFEALSVLFILGLPWAFIIPLSDRLYKSFKKGIFNNIWGKIGYMFGIFIMLITFLGFLNDIKDDQK